MKVLGQFFRYILNINTIWGLMILISFFLCLVQHYLPTTTMIATDCLREGENDVTIRITDRKKETREFRYVVTRAGGEVWLSAADQRPGSERPWLISVASTGAAWRLKWDTRADGEYEVRVGNQPVAIGRLVTLQSLTDAAFDYARSGFEIALGLVAAMVLFLGLMKVGEQAGIVQLVARLVHPVVRFLFPDVPRDHPASGAILMNITTTVLGLGNAATPFGLKAMQELQALNPHKEVASDSHVMLLGYNTAGFALLPSTLLALRKSAGCTDPFEVIGTCMVAGAASTITAIIMVKLLGRLRVFSLSAAVEELMREKGALAAAGSSVGRNGQ
jgi:spore maturation protein A